MESTRSSTIFTFSINLLLIFLTLFSAAASEAAAACNKKDESALLAFKSSFRYSSLTSWSRSTDCCSSWDFVGCDSASGRVTSLRFYNDYDMSEYIFLNGSIPAAIGDLSELERVEFSRISSLEGPIPPQLSKLKKLQSLQIYQTQVSGPVPNFLSELTSLKELQIGYNRLSGPIPASLGNLVHLTSLTLYGNQLTGTVPASLFSKLPKGSLATLVLSKNKLTGTIPKSFARVPFSNLYLDDNKLTGDALFLFGKSKPIVQINLARNSLAFDFGKAAFPVSTNYIDISHNEIYGSIPNGIAKLPNLNYFDVNSNKLCGKIPSGGMLVSPAENYANNKCLCGEPLQPCK
ncbi:polygalacturonase inhibitor-like [Iris pallida]|uniref:Polygalacturonase inhibitor-like n=1 Tax=Iris pallida TaxID=29817 RepID=A0AAX6HVU4_IRIPA|nr:polygalacturonase inhibitor-like [Iris pallida]KAJ6845186.1 polygalacturonase inhibitor-like [Iris pallida]